MTVYTADCRGSVANTSYKKKVEITCAADLQRAAAFDHVCAAYADGTDKQGNLIKARRSVSTFIHADCLPADMDNGHSDDPADWKTLDHIKAAFPSVEFYAVPSRNHFKEKNGKAARPKYHIYFPIDLVTDAGAYRQMKEHLLSIFPYFDENAKDAARFFFGVDGAQVEFMGGDHFMNLTAFLKQKPPVIMPPMPVIAVPVAAINALATRPARRFAPVETIPEGKRNGTLSRFAGRVLKKYGADDGKAAQAFRDEAAKCTPLLEEKELYTIWNSALNFYRGKVRSSQDYMPPNEYAAREFQEGLMPNHMTDVGQAKKLAAVYHDKLQYSDATLWLSYDGRKWEENSPAARRYVHLLTERQMKDAHGMVAAAQEAILTAQEGQDKVAEEAAKKDHALAETYHRFAREYQKTSRISATLLEATPYLQIDVDKLDADAFLLNTPSGTVDLRSGEIRPHNPADFCTKITGCAPGTDGAELFLDFLDRITCGDKGLQGYLQMIAGMFAVGAVFRECLIIAYGGGGNGKSSLFNLLAYVLGDYAGNMSAETLTANCRKNKSPEYAELRGKRLVIAAELEEGMRFDTAVIKKLCSTDKVQAEKKFKAPFSFTPSHTLVLYTNHLPKVGTTDKGTWDRLIVVPFTANLRGQKGEILNYARYLYEHAGSAVLAWIIEGAWLFIQAQYKIELPDCVRAAIRNYREDNDWVSQFIDECCEIGATFNQASGALYQEYRAYCARRGEYMRGSADFKTAVEGSGFDWRRTDAGAIYYGLRVKPSAYQDFIEVFEPTP